MRVLLFGGAGYIGTHVSLAFLDRGDTVGIYDNLSTGREENIQPGVKFYFGDIMDRKRVSEVLSEGWDCAVHLAALKAAGESMKEPEKYSTYNITGSLILITECLRAGCNNFILSSSAATYGEPEYLPIDEKHPTNPTNYYVKHVSMNLEIYYIDHPNLLHIFHIKEIHLHYNTLSEPLAQTNITIKKYQNKSYLS